MSWLSFLGECQWGTHVEGWGRRSRYMLGVHSECVSLKPDDGDIVGTDIVTKDKLSRLFLTRTKYFRRDNMRYNI